MSQKSPQVTCRHFLWQLIAVETLRSCRQQANSMHLEVHTILFFQPIQPHHTDNMLLLSSSRCSSLCCSSSGSLTIKFMMWCIKRLPAFCLAPAHRVVPVFRRAQTRLSTVAQLGPCPSAGITSQKLWLEFPSGSTQALPNGSPVTHVEPHQNKQSSSSPSATKVPQLQTRQSLSAKHSALEQLGHSTSGHRDKQQLSTSRTSVAAHIRKKNTVNHEKTMAANGEELLCVRRRKLLLRFGPKGKS